MTEAELRELSGLADKRDAIVSEWLKRLILLGSGSLSLLVSLRSADPAGGLAELCLKGSWVALALGILLASLRLYGDVWAARIAVERLATMRLERPAIAGVSQNAPIVWRLPWYIRAAERACYLSFVAAVVLLVVGAVLQP